MVIKTSCKLSRTLICYGSFTALFFKKNVVTGLVLMLDSIIHTFCHLLFLAFLQIKPTVCVIHVHMYVISIFHRSDTQQLNGSRYFFLVYPWQQTAICFTNNIAKRGSRSHIFFQMVKIEFQSPGEYLLNCLHVYNPLGP